MVTLASRLLAWMDRIGVEIRRRERVGFLGRQVDVIAGAVGKADYDDAWLVALSRDATVVFDVGCNMGQSSLLLLVPGAVRDAVLVDPNPLALSIAAENLIRNGLEARTRFVCAFMSDADGDEVEFFTVGAGAAGSMYKGHAKTAAALRRSTRVPTISLDALIARTGLVPDLVKIDVEGAESKVLAGATQLASRQKARFFVEVHSPPELPMRENAQRLLTWCRENRYRPWYLKEKLLLESVDLVAHRGRCHWLLLPHEESLPEYLRGIEQGAAAEKGRWW